jgi:hypothetical protein
MFSIAPHLEPICFGKCCPPFTYVGGQKGRNSVLQNRSFYFGGQSNWFIAKGEKKKKKKTWEAPHLINRCNSTKVSQLGKKWATRFIVDTLSNIKSPSDSCHFSLELVDGNITNHLS